MGRPQFEKLLSCMSEPLLCDTRGKDDCDGPQEDAETVVSATLYTCFQPMDASDISLAVQAST